MNRRDLVKAISLQTGVERRKVDAVLKGFTDVVIAVISKGESVSIRGFATFAKIDRPARIGRNPQTQEPVRIKASKKARITPLKGFKDAVVKPNLAPKLERGVWPPAPARAGAKRTAAKRAPAKKTAAKKTTAKKAPARKTTAKKATTAWGEEKSTDSVREVSGPREVVAPGLEQRHLQGRFPERVCLREVASLLVRVGVADAEPSSAALRPVQIPTEGVDVSLIVHSRGFTPRSPQRVTTRVFSGTNSDWVPFELEAAQEGVHTIEVMAFLGGTYLGDLPVQATIEADVGTGGSVDRSAPVGGRARDPGEVSLIINYDPESSVYGYQLVDWDGGFAEPSTSHRLLQTPYQAVEGLVSQLNELAQGTSPWGARTTTDWLQGQGIQLWDQFIPEALQREFWVRRDRISSLSIVSRGDPVPWELLYPFAPGRKEAGFLVDQFPVARWVFGQGPPSRLQLATGGLVLSGRSSLASAPAEVQAIAQLLRERNVLTETISELPALLATFAEESFGLLHFACHNSFGVSANSSQIMMGTEPFQPVFLARYRERFRQQSPLVFMNACRTDGQAPLYTRLDGWALSFLAAGAGAFVGSLWEVVDSSASLYAQEFYRAALSGESLGAATRKARTAIREESGDPTWLAYTLYGDPAAKIVPA